MNAIFCRLGASLALPLPGVYAGGRAEHLAACVRPVFPLAGQAIRRVIWLRRLLWSQNDG